MTDYSKYKEVTFEVTVRVYGWPEGEETRSGRYPAEYAENALRAAGIPDASSLDGFADLPAEARIDPNSVYSGWERSVD